MSHEKNRKNCDPLFIIILNPIYLLWKKALLQEIYSIIVLVYLSALKAQICTYFETRWEFDHLCFERANPKSVHQHFFFLCLLAITVTASSGKLMNWHPVTGRWPPPQLDLVSLTFCRHGLYLCCTTPQRDKWNHWFTQTLSVTVLFPLRCGQWPTGQSWTCGTMLPFYQEPVGPNPLYCY